MAGNIWGTLFRLVTFGESHGRAVGAVVDGCPAGIVLTESILQKELDRRRPGQSSVTTTRKEKDTVEIISGVFEGKTLGTPICALVYNKSFDSRSYESIKNSLRPGHADYTYWQKYGVYDWRGGGRSSGRETVGRVIGGTVAQQILRAQNIVILGYTTQVGSIKAKKFDPSIIETNEIRCADRDAALAMKKLIVQTKAASDSIGGVIELQVQGVPVGLGEPVFDKLSADIAKALVSIGSVKGVEFGSGFTVGEKKGSENNDIFTFEKGRIVTKTNQAGGILGGISSGNVILVRLAVKPPASIAQKQKTVTTYGKETEISVTGEHDPCLCPRLIPVAESMVALVLVDHWLRYRALNSF